MNSRISRTFIPTKHKEWWKPRSFAFAYGHGNNTFLFRCLTRHFGIFYFNGMQQIPRVGQNFPIQAASAERIMITADFHRQEIAILESHQQPL